MLSRMCWQMEMDAMLPITTPLGHRVLAKIRCGNRLIQSTEHWVLR